MILRRISAEFKTFAILLTAGILFGNILLVILSLAPMVYVALTFVYSGPAGMRMVRKETRLSTNVMQQVEISGDLSVKEGIGLVTSGDMLPDHFRIVEGSNFRVFWKGAKELDVPVTYTVECTKRGYYEICKARLESVHFAGLQQTRFIECDDRVELLVQQRSLDLRRMRDPRLLSRIPIPIGSVSKLGATTTDFKEIREYRPGDSFRSINWKASVRSADLEYSQPLVNEYEKEGKKVVWIFLDGSEGMSVGSSVENSFEYGIQAAYGLAQFYLARSCRVGIYVYNSGRKVLPDVGRRQKAMISKLLMNVEMTRLTGLLKSSVRDCRGHIAGSSPLFLVVTMVRPGNVDELKDGIKEMRMLSGNRSQIMVLHVSGNDLTATTDIEEAGAVAANLGGLKDIRDVSRSGAMMIPWNPRRQTLSHLMMTSLRRR